MKLDEHKPIKINNSLTNPSENGNPKFASINKKKKNEKKGIT